jgi:hypothetical protein
MKSDQAASVAAHEQGTHQPLNRIFGAELLYPRSSNEWEAPHLDPINTLYGDAPPSLTSGGPRQLAIHS